MKFSKYGSNYLLFKILIQVYITITKMIRKEKQPNVNSLPLYSLNYNFLFRTCIFVITKISDNIMDFLVKIF